MKTFLTQNNIPFSISGNTLPAPVNPKYYSAWCWLALGGIARTDNTIISVSIYEKKGEAKKKNGKKNQEKTKIPQVDYLSQKKKEEKNDRSRSHYCSARLYKRRYW